MRWRTLRTGLHSPPGPFSSWATPRRPSWLRSSCGGTRAIHRSSAISGQYLTFILGACVVAPAVASLIPAYAYVQLGWATDFSQAWRARTVSNAVASLTLIPAIVILWRYLWPRPSGVPARLGEYGLLLVGLSATHLAAGYIERTDVLALLVVLYTPVPFLLWATIRFGGAGLSVALVWTTFLTISSAFVGHGPLANNAGADTVIGIQLFLFATGVPMMVIAGLLQQNRSEHRALVDLERQKSAILRAHPDRMFVQSRDGVYLQFYARNPDDLLVSPELFIGKHMRDVLPADLADKFALAFQSVTFQEPTIIEYTLDMNGEPRRYESRVTGLDGDRVLSVVQDITDRWRSETGLREAQQRYALATAAGGIAVWEFNVQTGGVSVDGALHASLGYQAHEIGPNLLDWKRVFLPADWEDVYTRFVSFTGGARSNFELEFRMMHKDGSVRWFVSRGAVAEHVGTAPTRFIGTIADITERKAAAQALNEANDALIRMGRVAALTELSASIAHELHQPLTAIATNATACLRWVDATAIDGDVRDALTAVVTEAQRASHIVTRTHEMFTNQPMQKSVLNLNAAIRNVLEIAGGRLRERDVRLELRLLDELPAVLGDTVQIQQVLLNLVGNAVEALDGITDGPRVLRITSRRYRNGAVVSVRDTGRGFEPHAARRVFDPFYIDEGRRHGDGLDDQPLHHQQPRRFPVGSRQRRQRCDVPLHDPAAGFGQRRALARDANQGADCRRPRRTEEVDHAAGSSLGTQSCGCHGRTERPGGRADLPAGFRNSGCFPARNDRDRTRAPLTGSGVAATAVFDCPYGVPRARDPCGVPRGGIRCLSRQDRRPRTTGAPA